MFPPPGSYMPPPSSGSVPQAAAAPMPPPGGILPQKAAEMNQAVQQMHGMKIDDTSNNKFPGSLSASHSFPQMDGGKYNSTHSLSSFTGTHPPQNMNRAASTTNVTYSPQQRATYPYSSQGSTANNATAVPSSVPSKTLSSSYIGTHNGTSSAVYANTDVRKDIANGELSDPQLKQAHLYSSGPPSLLANQKTELNSHSDGPVKSPVLSPSHPGAPNGRSLYAPPSVQSGQIPYNPSGGTAAYHSVSTTASLKPLGIPNTQALYSPSGAHASFNAPGATSMPMSYNHPIAPSRTAPQHLPGAFPSGQASSSITGPTTRNPPIAPGGSAQYSSPSTPSGPIPYSSPGVPSGSSYSAAGIPGAPPTYSPSGLSGPVPYSPSSIPAGSSLQSPSGAPSGPYTSTPGVSSGPTQYSASGGPPGPTQYSTTGAPPGPLPFSPSGVPAGPAPYNVPGAPRGPMQYSHPGSPTGSVPYSPHGIPQAQPSLQQQQQQQGRMVLDQMPSTVEVREEDKTTRGGYYQTDTKCIPPPLVTTNFIVQDRGMCSPRFIRSTMYCLPNSPDVLKQTGIPFALVVNPMASVCDGENEPPLCMYREEGPLRCKRCKAYMCPFMTFGEGGRCFQCSFCKVATEVPQDYFSFLDGVGQRTDKFHRPELCLGSYEFIATKDYCKNSELPNPPAYIFMLEVSKGTLANGMVSLLCQNMKTVLSALHGDEKKTSIKVGFVTYNNVLHFYNLKKSLSQPHVMVMPDVHDAFVPLLDGFLVSLTEAEVLIDSLMEQIPQMYTNEPSGEVLFGPVVQAGLEALKNANCAGKLLIFHSTLPTCDAPGKLQKRDGQKLLGTEKQKIVLTPQNPLYSKLAEECVAAGCCIDLFLFPNDYIDVASMSPLCRHTGGHMYKYMYFQADSDGNRFLEDLERNVSTPTAFDAVLRIRTSAGISPVFHYGNFFMSNATDIEISALNGHKAATVELAYDEKLTENDTVYIQAALLYTTCDGDRRIRVHNLALNTSTAVSDVYRGCELDTIVNFLSKQGLKQVFDQTPQQIRTTLVTRAVKMLAAYRKHCSATSSSSQLILPETLKLLPVYTNCVLKSDALTGGPEISLDDRSFAMLTANGMHVGTSAFYFYPILISLHDLDVNSDEMPVPIRCSMEKLCSSGAYLLTNGIYMFLWISQGISPEWVRDVFGVPSASAINKQQSSLMELDNPLSKRICHIIEDLEEMSLWCMRLNIVLQGDKLEIVFRQFLVEDRGVDGSPSYVEFLCHLHKEITKLL